MTRQIKNPQISLRTTALVLTGALALICTVEAGAIKAYEDKKIGYKKQGAEYCIKCHTDSKTIRLMREKEGGVGDIFNKDGTFKDPAFEKYNPDYKHKEPITP